MEYSLVPSLPATSFTDLATLASALKGHVAELQVDIVDGKFVPPISWPFSEVDPLTELSKLALLTKDFALEMDCMVTRPERYLDTFVSLGIKRVVIHVGSTEVYEDIFAHAQTHGYTVGLAFSNDQPLTEWERYKIDVFFIQLMGIKAIGQQGQPFDERTLDRARSLRATYPELEIAVDGSVNKDTIQSLKTAGVNRFLPGSAIAKMADPLAAYQELLTLLQS